MAGRIYNFAATVAVLVEFSPANLFSTDNDEAIAQPNYNFN